MVPFLEPLRPRAAVQRGPTDLRYESWALPPARGPRGSGSCEGGACACADGPDGIERCDDDRGCGCATCDTQRIAASSLRPMTSPTGWAAGAGGGRRWTQPGDYWGRLPDGTWVFWEGPEIGWWDRVPGPWDPDPIDIPWPGPGGGDPPAPGPGRFSGPGL